MLVNPTAGKGKGARHADAALKRFADAGYDVHVVVGRDAADATRQARNAVAEGVATLVACGGDGLVHLAVQAVAGTDVRLGIIPAGTGNDVARYLDLPRRHPVAAPGRVIASPPRTIHLAQSGDRFFPPVLATGLHSTPK